MGITLQLTGIQGVDNNKLVKSSNGINVNVTRKQNVLLQYGLGDNVIRPGLGKVIRICPTFGSLGDGALRFDVSGPAVAVAFYTANDAALRVLWFSVSGPKPGTNVQTQPTVTGATSYHEMNFVYNPDDTEFYFTMVQEMVAVIQGIPGVVQANANDNNCDIMVGIGTTSDPFIIYPSGFVIPSVNYAEDTTLRVQNPGSFFDVSGSGKYVQMYAPAGGHFFWLKVTNGVNTQTVPTGVGTAHMVSILLADTSEDITTKLETEILATGVFYTNRLSESVVAVTNINAGDATDATAETSGFIVTVHTDGGDVESPFLLSEALNEGRPEQTLGQVTSVDFRMRQFVYDNNSTNEVLSPWNGDRTVNWSFNTNYRLTPKDVPNKGITLQSKDNTTYGAYLTVSVSIAIFVLAGSKKSDYGLGSGNFVAGELFVGSYTQTTLLSAFRGIEQGQTVHYNIYCIDPAWISVTGGNPFIDISGRFDKLDDITSRTFGPLGNISLLLTYTRTGVNVTDFPRFVEKVALQASGLGYSAGNLLANSPTVTLKAITL